MKNVENIKICFTIPFLSGYCNVASKLMYWERVVDMHNSEVAQIKTSNGFEGGKGWDFQISDLVKNPEGTDI